MGYGDLSCYGEKRVQHRHIDRMAAEGIRFTQFYVNCPDLLALRAPRLTTGQYPARWKITSYPGQPAENRQRGMAQWLDPDRTDPRPTICKAAGYTTGHFGKWHMGGQRDVGEAPLITEYGFDKTLTTFEGLGDRVLPMLDAFDGKPADQICTGQRQTRPRQHHLDGPLEGHDVLRRRARSQFMQKGRAGRQTVLRRRLARRCPLALFPAQSAAGRWDQEELYLGVVQATDDQLAPLFDYRPQQPETPRQHADRHRQRQRPRARRGSAGPFRGHKGNLYEGGIREPLIVWGPGLLNKSALGTTNATTVVAGMDFLPSMLALARRKPADDEVMDGQDLSQPLLGNDRANGQTPLLAPPPDRPGPANDPFPDLAVRDGDWKLLDQRRRLFPAALRLSKDIKEKNLAPRSPKSSSA